MNFEIWKNNLLKKTEIISDEESCKRVVDMIVNKTKLLSTAFGASSDNSWPYTSDKLVVGLDCEGVNLGVKGKPTLIQIAVDKEIYIFDILKCPGIIKSGLKRILEDPNIIKVIHSCDNDVLSLYYKCDVKINCIFDTQIAHSILTEQNSGKREIRKGLNYIYEYYGFTPNHLKNNLKNIYKKDQKYWARRPLTKEMTLYASGDVENLVNDKIYGAMVKDFSNKNRILMTHLCRKKMLIYQKYNKYSKQQQGRNVLKRRQRMRDRKNRWNDNRNFSMLPNKICYNAHQRY